MEDYLRDMLGDEEVDSMNLLIEGCYSLLYETHIQEDGDGFIRDIWVKIVTNDMDDDGNELQIEIGNVRINMLRNMYLLDHREGSDYCDMKSQNFFDGFCDIFKDADKRGKKISLEAYSEYIYIDEFRLKPEFRGQGIGSAVVREIIDFIGGRDSLFVLIPFAIEDRDNKEAHKKVRRFWETLGFKKFNRSRFFILVD